MAKHFFWSLLAAVTLVATLTQAKAEYGPPAVLNCSNAPIGVTISRPDGKLLSMPLRPGAALAQPIRNSRILSIRSSSSGYGKAELGRLRSKHHVSEELWVVTPNSIELIEFSDLSKRRKSCQ